MNVAIDKFGGIVPRLAPHQLIASGASVAHDVQLRNGKLEAWRTPCQFTTAAGATSFHIHGCCVLAWPFHTCVADVSPDWGRIYMTSQDSSRFGAWVVEPSGSDALCSATYTRLGLPAPIGAPSASGSTECGRGTDARAYVYTYVNKWGEESAPSPVSNVVRVKNSGSVSVSGFTRPDSSYGITHYNVYRAASGFFAEDAKTQNDLTDFFYVGTVTIGTSSFSDSVLSAFLGAPLETDKVSPPPNGLQNLTAIGGMVRLAGSKYNRVYLSENMEPYNWPVKYELTLDHNIVHMKAIGKLLYVTTDSTAYTIDTSGCTDQGVCANVRESRLPYPDIGCSYNDTAITTPFGLAYSTPYGVGILDNQANVTIVTKGWFSENDWVQLAPETARLGWWEGYLFIVTDQAAFMLNIDRDSTGNFSGGELTTISDSPIAMQTSSTGKLFYLQNNRIYIWNQGTELRPYLWESRQLTGQHDAAGSGNALGATWSPSSAKVGSEGAVEFTLETQHGTVFQRTIPGNRPFRLPRVGRHGFYKVRLEGTSPVEYVDLGTAHWTVNMGA